MFPSFVRRALSLLGAALGVACAAPVASAEVARGAPPVEPSTGAVEKRAPVPSEPTTDADRSAGVEWRFDAGSTVHAAPAVGADGTVYVGTGDGYVEAVNADGSLKWSYTVEGAVAWSPLVDGVDHVLVATAAERLFSIGPSGLLAWHVRPPAHVSTGLALAPSSSFVFGATDGSLWAYSIHGTALWHVETGGTLSTLPAVRGNRAAIGTEGGVLWLLDGAQKRFSIRLEAPLRGTPAILEDGSVFALSGSVLVQVDARGNVLSRREGVETFGTSARGLLIVERTGDLVLFSSRDGSTLRVPLPSKASAPPVEIAEGSACVATESGELVFVRQGSVARTVSIARAPLHVPVLDRPRGRVIVAAGSGRIAAVRVEG